MWHNVTNTRIFWQNIYEKKLGHVWQLFYEWKNSLDGGIPQPQRISWFTLLWRISSFCIWLDNQRNTSFCIWNERWFPPYYGPETEFSWIKKNFEGQNLLISVCHIVVCGASQIEIFGRKKKTTYEVVKLWYYQNRDITLVHQLFSCAWKWYANPFIFFTNVAPMRFVWDLMFDPLIPACLTR